MVGAVIVADGGRIIGEGFHRRFGGPHAEVNAVRSVADASLLRGATVYVTLEPCSHYGKTPPCADLLVDSGVGRVVVGAGDPNPRVAGRGIAILRDHGIEVTENVLADECRRLNAAFMTAHTLHRPLVTLKWAQSADGFIDIRRASADASPGTLFIAADSGSRSQAAFVERCHSCRFRNRHSRQSEARCAPVAVGTHAAGHITRPSRTYFFLCRIQRYSPQNQDDGRP